MKPVKFFKTALSRQVAEAARILRRGGAGAILNSKNEFNRCQIPRLKVEEEEDEPTILRMEQEEERQRDETYQTGSAP